MIPSASGRRRCRLALLALAALAVAGCDKCGHRIQLVAPSIQHACGDNTEPR